MPPSRSIPWKASQAAPVSSAVRLSKPPAPAAGSATLARLDSSMSTIWLLRATRRAKASGSPSAWV
ncbi:hypothetical protein AEGHOMDF_6051 [Methylobacterium soli]|nr:hypothetical protein AEGHOMDF_6051 [Methylobacterium soli]